MNFRTALLATAASVCLIGATPAFACGMYGGGYYGYGYNPDGMTYLEQLEEAKKERKQRAERKAARMEMERARTAFASRFKVDPAPSETPQDGPESQATAQQSSSSTPTG